MDRKKSAFAVLKENVNSLLTLFEDTPTLDLQAECVEGAIRFVCLFMNDKRFSTGDINDLRYKLFTKKGLTGEKLPPTLDALVLHLRRAAYQWYIWKHTCTPVVVLPSPISNCWVVSEKQLEPEFNVLGGVSKNVLELVSCRCQKRCKKNACASRKSKVACSNACNCDMNYSCENTEHFIDDDHDSDVDMWMIWWTWQYSINIVLYNFYFIVVRILIRFTRVKVLKYELK